MRPIILIAAVPLLLTACKLGDGNDSNSSTTTNATVSGAIPDTVEVNGVTYVRADKAATPPPAPSPTAGASSLFGSATSGSGSSSTSDSGSSVPPNTAAGSTLAADHGE